MPLIVVAGALRGPDGYLVARRAPTERAYPGCWELPGGKAFRDTQWCDRCGLENKPETPLGLPCLTEDANHHRWTCRPEGLYEALVREWREETGLRVDTVGRHPIIVLNLHTPQHGDVEITLYELRTTTGLAVDAYPEQLPVHSCAMYMTPEQMLRVPEWAATPSLHPFARALRDRS